METVFASKLFSLPHIWTCKAKQNCRMNRTSKTNFKEIKNSIFETIIINRQCFCRHYLFVQNRSIRIILPALKYTKHYSRVIRVKCSFDNNSNCIVFLKLIRNEHTQKDKHMKHDTLSERAERRELHLKYKMGKFVVNVQKNWAITLRFLQNS